VRARRSNSALGAANIGRGAALWLMSALFSVGLHLSAATPWLAWTWVHRDDADAIGDEGTTDGPTGNSGGEVALGAPSAAPPVQISVYTPTTATAASEPVAAPIDANAPSSDATPTPPRPSAEQPQVRGTTYEQRTANREAAREASAAGAADGDTHTLDDSTASKSGVGGQKPRGNKKPCEPVEEIVQINATKWRVERDLVDYYATHLRELDRQAGVAVHKNDAGETDGARMYLPRCSVLRQVGIKNGDVIHTINGRKISSVAEAVATYLVLRNDDNLSVALTRKTGERLTLHYRMKR
jgi:S1-C subfamily serine protease